MMKARLSLALCGGILALWSNTVPAQVSEVPLLATAWDTELILIPVTVEGRPGRFIIDTGAPVGLLSHFSQAIEARPQRWKRFDDANGAKRRYGLTTLNAIEIAGRRFLDREAVLHDNPALNLALSCLGADGIIGYNLLRNSIWEIDKKRGSVRFSRDADEFVTAGLSWVALDNPGLWSAPRLRVSLAKPLPDGHWMTLTENMMLDTGDSGSPLSVGQKMVDAGAENGFWGELTSRSAQGMTSIGSAGSHYERDAWNGVVPKVTLGGLELRQVEADSTRNRQSRLGAALFNYGRVVMDLKNWRIYFDPWEQPLESGRGDYGFSTWLQGSRLMVANIYRQSPAERLGLAVKDQIINVNGQAVADLAGSCERLSLVRKVSVNGNTLRLLVRQSNHDEPRLIEVPRYDYRKPSQTASSYIAGSAE